MKQVPVIYPLRNGNDSIVPFCRLSLTRDSFVSASVREWNNLNLSVRNLDTLSKFKKAIRSSISMPIPRHYYYSPRKLNIILTQLRCNASFLNYDLCKVKILSNASCNCGAPCENSHHFFFDCDKYTDNKEILFNSLNWLPSNINIDVNLLTKGNDLLTYQENITIFKHAFKYINEKISNILENASYKNANNKINFLFNNKLYSILRLTSSFISNCLNIRTDLL
jgi:hypothetical protein